MMNIHEAMDAKNASELIAAIDRGEGINATNEKGWTPLHRAVAKSSGQPLSIIKRMLAAGADLNARTPPGDGDCAGGTPLLVAAVWERWDAVEEFVKAGADINTESANGFTPLFWACKEDAGNYDLFRAMVGWGANVNHKNSKGSLLYDQLTAWNLYGPAGHLKNKYGAQGRN